MLDFSLETVCLLSRAPLSVRLNLILHILGPFLSERNYHGAIKNSQKTVAP